MMNHKVTSSTKLIKVVMEEEVEVTTTTKKNRGKRPLSFFAKTLPREVI